MERQGMGQQIASADVSAALAPYYPLFNMSPTVWFRGDSLQLVAATGALQLVDKSGNGHYATATGPSVTALANAIGTRAGFQTNGTQAYNVGGWTAISQPFSVIWIGYSSVPAATAIMFDGIGAVPRVAGYFGGGFTGMYAGTDVLLNQNYQLNSAGLYVANFNTTSSELFVNNVTTPIASGNANVNTMNTLRLFADNNGLTALTGVTAEFLVTPLLSAAERAAFVNSYVKVYYPTLATVVSV